MCLFIFIHHLPRKNDIIGFDLTIFVRWFHEIFVSSLDYFTVLKKYRWLAWQHRGWRHKLLTSHMKWETFQSLTELLWYGFFTRVEVSWISSGKIFRVREGEVGSNIYEIFSCGKFSNILTWSLNFEISHKCSADYSPAPGCQAEECRNRLWFNYSWLWFSCNSLYNFTNLNCNMLIIIASQSESYNNNFGKINYVNGGVIN